MDANRTKEFYRGILNDHEVAELETFNERPSLQSAIKKVILSAIYHEGVLKPGETPDVGNNYLLLLANAGELTNEFLGADLKARVKACALLENGYKNLALFKKFSEKVKEVKPNDAK